MATAQQKQSDSTTSGASSDAIPIPQVSIQFSGPKLLSVSSSPFIVDPMQCSADGRAFWETVQKEDVLRRSLNSVSASGDVETFDRANLPGLRDVQIVTFFPGAAHVVTLIFARPDNVTPGDKKPAAKLENYLVVQDQKGQRVKVIELKLRIKPLQVAELNSGSFLVIGVEPVNNLPELELLDADGNLIRPLDVESPTYGNSPSIKDVFGEKGGSEPGKLLGWSHFIPWGQQVLLVQGGSQMPVFVIGDSGIQRTVKISMPPKMEMESILPMRGGWLVRMRNAEDLSRLAGQKVVYGMQSRLYEVNSETGEIIREVLPPGDMRTNEIVCAAENEFLALHLIFKDNNYDAAQLGLFRGSF